VIFDSTRKEIILTKSANYLPEIHFERITAQTVLEICKMSETLSDTQRESVGDNALSIAQAHFSENVWMRAIYADQTPVGFIMLHLGSDWADGIDCPGVFLWRLMIAQPYQGLGYGKKAMAKLIDHLRAFGIPELYTSYKTGEGGPGEFYRKFGFVPTGDYYGDEPEVVLELV
jgi:diamine N-acetyltransferase